MEGVQAYKLPSAVSNALAGSVDETPEVVEIGGIAYLWYAQNKMLVNLQAISEKFKTWEEVKAQLGVK